MLLKLKQKPVIRIVAFHDILPKELEHFKTNLCFLKHNTNVVSLDDFFSSRLVTNKINTVITFDDGYRSWITHVFPILKELKLAATFFISSGFVGLSKNEEATYTKTNLFKKMLPREITGCLKETDIRRLADNGFSIGGHTLNHIDLEVARNIDQLKYEIAEDKLRLEKITGTNIKYFSYPTGAYKNTEIDLTKLLREIGYKAAVTTITGFNTTNTNPFFLRRELTGAAMPHNLFKARVYGNYDAVNYIKKCINVFKLYHFY
jgi:peptidoglycan/xylan/chitin deacetylase (PgdA/CDA1 family)